LSADWQSRVTPQVENIWKSAQSTSSNGAQPTGVDSVATARKSTARIRYDSNGRLQIDVSFDCTQSAPKAALVVAGMVIGTTVKVPPMCVVEGWALVETIPALASLPSIKKID